MYQPLRPSRSEFVPIRSQRYHLRLWGDPRPGRVPLVMVHGWMDVAASYQFVVDALAQDHFIIAPDWRGYGLTWSGPPAAAMGRPEQGMAPSGGSAVREATSVGAPVDTYWYPDYLADLDLLLDHYAGDGQVDLVGHSMGGNIVMMYAGVRPQRIRRLVNLEGFGWPQTPPSEAPKRYGVWIDELKSLHRGEIGLNSYDSAAGVARRLMKTNRRLPQDKADWLALQWARPVRQADGSERWEILGDPAHRIKLATLSRADELLELYRCISAPTLVMEASDNSLTGWWKGRFSLDEFHQRLGQLHDCRIARVEDAGHMLHHDQPGQVARLIEGFLG